MNTINMIWVGDSISPIEYLSIKSFLCNGHDVHFYCYNPIECLPEGTIVCDANEIIPQDQIFKHKGSYAAFADLFRWKLMALKGGYYVDTDMICIKRFDFNQDVIVGWEKKCLSITPTVLGFKEKGHIVAEDMLHNANNPLAIRPYDAFRVKLKKLWLKYTKGKNSVKALGWGATAGPRGLSEYFKYNEKNLDMIPLDPEVFYPIPCTEWEKIIKEDAYHMKDFGESTYALHLWNEMWRRAGVEKTQKFPKNSLIGELFEKYCPEILS